MLGAGHSVWHWDVGQCLCWSWWDSVSCWQQTLECFTDGSSMEIAASRRIITALLGRTPGMGEAQGQVGKLLFSDCSAPASHDAARDI